MTVTMPFFRFWAFVYGMLWAYMKARQTFRAVMLPDGLPLRAQDVANRADMLTHAAVNTFFPVAGEILIQHFLPSHPFRSEFRHGLRKVLPD